MKHIGVVKYFVSQKEMELQEQHNVCQKNTRGIAQLVEQSCGK